PGHLLLGIGAWMSWADEPLIARLPAGDQKVLQDRFGVDFTGSLGLWHRLLVWADMPFVPHPTGTLMPLCGMRLPQSGIGDLRVGAKGLLGTVPAGGGASFGFALGGFASLPTGDTQNFTGSRPFGQVGPVIELHVGEFSAAINAAAVLRESNF